MEWKSESVEISPDLQAFEFMKALVIATGGQFLNHAVERKSCAVQAYRLVDALAEARAERATR